MYVNFGRFRKTNCIQSVRVLILYKQQCIREFSGQPRLNVCFFFRKPRKYLKKVKLLDEFDIIIVNATFQKPLSHEVVDVFSQ